MTTAANASAADLELAIHAAMRAKDMPAVVGLMRILVVKDPRRAQLLLDIIRVGLALPERPEADR